MLFQHIDGHVSGRTSRLFREALPFLPDPADHRDRAPRSQAGGIDPVGEDQEEGEGPRIGFFWPEARVQGGGGQEDVGPGRPVSLKKGDKASSGTSSRTFFGDLPREISYSKRIPRKWLIVAV